MGSWEEPSRKGDVLKRVLRRITMCQACDIESVAFKFSPARLARYKSTGPRKWDGVRCLLGFVTPSTARGDFFAE